MFSSILKHEYETGIRDINTHLELILKYASNVKNQFIFSFYINRNSNPKSFHSYNQSLSLSNDTHFFKFFLFSFHISKSSIFSFHISYPWSLSSLSPTVTDRHHLFAG